VRTALPNGPLCCDCPYLVLTTPVGPLYTNRIETGFVPAASHALGWGPIETSAVFGSISVVIFIVMLFVYQLSSHKVRDASLLSFGLCLSAFGYTLLYLWWTMGAPVWHFIVPMIVGTSAFPFLGAPSRSLFTKAVETKPSLAKYGGTMQAVLSMAASVAGFVTPGLVARYVLRNPGQVESSRKHREMSPLALFAPLLSLSTLAGLMYIAWKHKRMDVVDAAVELGSNVKEADEGTSLMPGADDRQKRYSCPGPSRRYSCHEESYRRQSACLMGIPQSSMLYEHDFGDEDEDES